MGRELKVMINGELKPYQVHLQELIYVIFLTLGLMLRMRLCVKWQGMAYRQT
jgi:hypothetical protein